MTNLNIEPDIKISVNQTFGIDSNMEIEAFSKKNEYVPEIDKNYKLIKIPLLRSYLVFRLIKDVWFLAIMELENLHI